MLPGEHMTARHYNELLDYVRRSTPLSGRGTSISYTQGGARIDTSPSASGEMCHHHPFELSGLSENGSAVFSVYLPPECVMSGDRALAVEGVEESDGRTLLAQEVVEGLTDEPRTLYLVVYKPDEPEEGEDDEGHDLVAELTLADEEPDGEIVSVYPVADLAVQTVGGKSYGCVSEQRLSSAVSVGSLAADPDEASVDENGGEDGGLLQIAHFNDDERDSGKGLANRLKADTETGSLSCVGDEDVMLVCRSSDGKILYMPLEGDGEDPAPEEDECKDPSGDEGVPAEGVDASAESDMHGAGVPSGVGSGSGGQYGKACETC